MGKQFYRNSSNIHIPSASSFYSLCYILFGIQSGILSLTFDLIPSDSLFGIFSGILISHSYLTCFLRFFQALCPQKDRRSPQQAQKVRRGPQRFSSRKSPARPTGTVALQKSGETHGDQDCPARPTAIRNWQVQPSEAADEVRQVSLQSRAGK